MSAESFKPKENIKSEFEELKELQERREKLQRRLDACFDKIQTLDAKYPSRVQFDEQNRFRGDRSFYTSEDLRVYRPLNDEMTRIEAERNVLDEQILKRRFDLGVKHLTTLNQQGTAIWKRTSRHEPNPSNQMDILYVEEWRCVAGDIDARISITGERTSSFFEGMRHMAQQLEDVEVLERMRKWPRERNLRFNNVTFAFSSGLRSWFRRRTSDLESSGFMVQKHYDPYEPEQDSMSAHLPPSAAYSFPTIEQEGLEKAKNQMNTLIGKLKIDL